MCHQAVAGTLYRHSILIDIFACGPLIKQCHCLVRYFDPRSRDLRSPCCRMMWLLLLLLLLLLIMAVIHSADDDYIQTDRYHINLSHHNRSTTAACTQNVNCTLNTSYNFTTLQTNADCLNFSVEVPEDIDQCCMLRKHKKLFWSSSSYHSNIFCLSHFL